MIEMIYMINDMYINSYIGGIVIIVRHGSRRERTGSPPKKKLAKKIKNVRFSLKNLQNMPNMFRIYTLNFILSIFYS